MHIKWHNDFVCGWATGGVKYLILVLLINCAAFFFFSSFLIEIFEGFQSIPSAKLKDFINILGSSTQKFHWKHSK